MPVRTGPQNGPQNAKVVQASYPRVVKSAGRGEPLGGVAVAGPLLFTLAWLIAWPVQDEYSPRRETISALAAVDAQQGWIMILGFLALGLGTAALGLALPRAVRGGVSTRIGAALLLLAGLGIVVAGLARLDCSPGLAVCDTRIDAGDVSWHHKVHDLAGVLVFQALVIAQFVLARAFQRDDRWRDLRTYSVISGVASVVLLVLFGTGVTGDWNGLMQRLFLALPLVWIVVVGVRVRGLFAARGRAPVPAS